MAADAAFATIAPPVAGLATEAAVSRVHAAWPLPESPADAIPLSKSDSALDTWQWLWELEWSGMNGGRTPKRHLRRADAADSSHTAVQVEPAL